MHVWKRVHPCLKWQSRLAAKESAGFHLTLGEFPGFVFSHLEKQPGCNQLKTVSESVNFYVEIMFPNSTLERIK